MKINTEPQKIFDEYKSGKEFNQSCDLYENVEKNRRFFLGDQWAGVNAPDLTKPVFNIIKRVTTYYSAMLVSDDIGVNIRPFDETERSKALYEIMSNEVMAVMERTKTKQKARTNIKDSCIDGDTAVYVDFDPDIETNQLVSGDITTDIIDNTHIIFGNPYSSDVQSQPYILIVQRLFTDQVKDMAREMGVSDAEIDNIVPDEDDYLNLEGDSTAKALTTVITKFWKVKKSEEVRDERVPNMTVQKVRNVVHFTRCTEKVTLKADTETGQRLYPLAWMSWEKQKNNYHGRSPITGLIPNQIFVNKIYAMCMVYMTNMGFPKVFYDQNKIAKLTNNVTSATAITNMDLAGKMIDAVKAPDFSSQIMSLVDSVIAYTKDFMGASDAALGNISNPNNTSAIVAVQQASSAPLEIQRLDYYQFMEDIVRVMADIMGAKYGVRKCRVTETEAKALNLIDHYEYVNPMTGAVLPAPADPFTGQPAMENEMIPPGYVQKTVYKTYADIDFSQLANVNYDIDVEVGQSSYWSETTTIQTMDNLYQNKIITDPILYLEAIPDKIIPNKQRIIDAIKSQQETQQEQLQAMQQAAQMQAQAQAPVPDGQDNRSKATAADNEALQEVYQKSKEYYDPTLDGSGLAEVKQS